MAETTAEVTKLLGVSLLLRAKSHKTQLMMGLLRLPWRLISGILDMGVGPNLIRNSAIIQVYWKKLKEINPK